MIYNFRIVAIFQRMVYLKIFSIWKSNLLSEDEVLEKFWYNKLQLQFFM